MPDPSAERLSRCPSRGERCSLCGAPATHKVGEEIPWDDPVPDRHNLTAYVCCTHFRLILSWATRCGGPTSASEAWPCPYCRGLRDVADAAAAFTSGPGPGVTPCRLCQGKGRVLVLPLPDEGAVP
jgi:hypothetical protein